MDSFKKYIFKEKDKYIFQNKMYDSLNSVKMSEGHYDAMMKSRWDDMYLQKIREYDYTTDEYPEEDSIDEDSKARNDALLEETRRQLEEAHRKQEAEEARRRAAKEEAKRKAAEAKAKAEEEAKTEAAVGELVDAFLGRT